MIKNAIYEIRIYKRLPVLTGWAWMCILLVAVIIVVALRME